MFLTRDAELSRLQHWWDGSQPELITLYGRRQVGKTELLVHFLTNKRAIYFYADQQLVGDHLRAFTEQVATLTNDAVLTLQPFASWEAALTYVLRLAHTERLAIVIQRLWDGARRAETQAYIVLCTSFTAAVERHFQVDGPLYRRRTRDLRLEPFTYYEAALFYPHWSRAEQMIAWGMVGGVPSYLHAFRGEPLQDAAVAALLDKSAPLYREAETLLAQEVRGIGPHLLHTILGAIANGCTVSNQIAQRVGRPATSLSGALRFLVEYGLVERRLPYTVMNPERSKQAHYTIADNYLSFWFRFVLPNRSALERGQSSYIWQSKILPALSTYMGGRFERACQEYIQRTQERWSHAVPEVGRWWQGDEELEIVGHEAGQVVLAAEAKWSESRVGLNILRTLQRRVALLPNVAIDCQLVLFSKTGFTPDLEALRDPTLVLCTLDDLYL